MTSAKESPTTKNSRRTITDRLAKIDRQLTKAEQRVLELQKKRSDIVAVARRAAESALAALGVPGYEKS